MNGDRKDRESVDRTLGRHDAEIENTQRNVDDLKNRLEKSESELRRALRQWYKDSSAFRKETHKTIWLRRGFLAALGLLFAAYAYIVAADRPLAQEIVSWLIHESPKH